MKFLRVDGLDQLNKALCFDSHDCRAVGGLEIYSTKNTSIDTKHFKGLIQSINTRYEADLRTTQSMSPPTSPEESSSTAAALLSSPFGPLNEKSACRTLSFLLGTLNASHPDYDFFSVIRPWDFKRLPISKVMSEFETTIFNLGHRQINGLWKKIDAEMELRGCKVYQYAPEDDPFVDDGALWSQHYLLYNKNKKRVCYLYLRGFGSHDGDYWSDDRSDNVWGDLDYDDDDLAYGMEL